MTCENNAGGSGFVGRCLAQQMLQRRADVFVYDCAPPQLPTKAIYTLGDVTDKGNLVAKMSEFRPTCVIHLASWGMSGPNMLNPKCSHINIEGARASLEASAECSVESFIYLSTYNVVFHGQTIEGGDESMPYSPPHCHTDCYSPSKAEAEKLVLEANGRRLSGGGKLITCVLRPAAIYGVGEQRHLPRILKMVDLGLLARIGHAVVDWVHVENLVHAILLAHKATTSLKGNVSKAPAGHAYFISDNDPMNNFDFLRPIVESRGKQYPPLTGRLFCLSLRERVAHFFK